MMCTLVAPQQPGLRAFIVYDSAPAGCLPFLVRDERTAPLLRAGDTVLIDTTDREPAERELFVIRWMDGTSDIVEAWSREGRYGCGPDGEMIETRCWFVAAYDRPRTSEGWRDRLASDGITRWGFADGPYATEGPNAGVLGEKLIGRIVGILSTTGGLA